MQGVDDVEMNPTTVICAQCGHLPRAAIHQRPRNGQNIHSFARRDSYFDPCADMTVITLTS